MENTEKADFMTADEVAELTKLNKGTIYHLAKKGKIPSYKFVGNLRFKRAEIEELFVKETI